MKKYAVITRTKQGEYLKPQYDESNSKVWTHYIHSWKNHAEKWAYQKGLKDFEIITINL